MKRITFALCVGLAMVSSADASDQIPGAPQKQPVAILDATIHPVSGPDIENGTLLFDKGRIVAVGQNVELPDGVQKINAKGRHVYPSLFEAQTQLGLVEVRAVRATRDEAEVGRINPNVRANAAFNPDSELIPVTRSNGVLLAVAAPVRGLISGRAAVMQLDGWTWEEMTLKPDVGMMVNWPEMPAVLRGTGSTKSDANKTESDDPIEELRTLFDDARAWQKARSADESRQPFDIRLQALQPVLNRKMPLIVRADEAAEIQSAVAFAAEQDVRLIIHGGYDAIQCAPLLKKHDIPVIVSMVYRKPRRRDDDYDAPYTLPERLREAGIRFCISGVPTRWSSNARNLPYHAATAAAYGLPKDEALRSITLSPAEILGVADRVGSLEVGKDATLIVTNGDSLETATQVQRAWVQGRQVDLTNRHTQLYNKYRRKYQQQREADGD